MLAWHGIAHVDVLVPRAIPFDLEGRDHVAEVSLEQILVSEDQGANRGVQSIGADHQIEAARRRTLELDFYSVGRLPDTRDAVAKNGFTAPVDPAMDQAGEAAPRDAQVAAARQLTEYVDTEAPDAMPAIIDKTQLLRLGIAARGAAAAASGRCLLGCASEVVGIAVRTRSPVARQATNLIMTDSCTAPFDANATGLLQFLAQRMRLSGQYAIVLD